MIRSVCPYGQGKFSAFPLPRAASLATDDEKARAAVSKLHGTSTSTNHDYDPVGLDPWRPNIHIFRPQDYWRGSVDYVPSKLGDGDDCNPEGVQAESTKPGLRVELELELLAGSSVECASDRRTSLEPGEVEAALHKTLDVLRKVRAERLRVLTTRFSPTPETTG